MFNSPLWKSLLFLTILVFVFSPFQNCSQNPGFKTDLGKVPATEETFVGQLDTDEPEEVVPSETSYQPLLADRKYLESLIADIFGPMATSIDSTKLINDAQNHGSPCSIYEDYGTLTASGSRTRAVASRACSPLSSAYLNSTPNPKVSVTRQALVARACSDLVSNAATLSYALKRIDSSRPIPEVSSQAILKLFRLFYREKPAPHDGLTDSLLLMFNNDPKPGRDVWASVIYTVCVSSYWQIL